MRSFNSQAYSWTYQGTSVSDIPKPFGGNDLAGDGTAKYEGLLWWHNFYSYVMVANSASPPEWRYRGQFGQLVNFYSCFAATGSTCWANANDGYRGARDLLQYSNTATPEFRVYSDAGDVFVFRDQWQSPQQGATFYFLSEIIAAPCPAALNSAVKKATLTYSTPVDSSEVPLAGCLSNGLPGNAPYLSKITTADGAELRFYYKKLTRPASSVAECVLQSVTLSRPGVAQTIPLATYSYRAAGGTEEPGRLNTVVIGTDMRREVYAYTATNDLPDTFSKKDGTPGLEFETTAHTYSAQRVSRAVHFGMDLSATYQDPVINYNSSTSVVDANARTGTGDPTASGGAMTTAYEYSRRTNGIDTPYGSQMTEVCSTGQCLTATVSTEVGTAGLWDGHLYRDVDYEKARVDGRKARTEYPDRQSNDGRLERDYMCAGLDNTSAQSCATGSTPLYREDYTYVSGPNREQLPSTIRVASALDPSLGAAETKYVWDTAGDGRLKAVFKKGWTQDVLGNVVQRTVATFFYADAIAGVTCIASGSDTRRRPIEVQGPCIVNDYTATSCGDVNSNTFPITQYEYWADGNGTRSGHIKSMRRFAGACSGGGAVLTSWFDDYDLFGNPTAVRDEAGVASTMTYDNDGNLKTIVRNGKLWEYDYDNGALSSIKLPSASGEANDYIVFCHRSSPAGSSAACDRATKSWHPEVQWIAKSQSATGDTWSEKIKYTYAADGSVDRQDVLGGCSVSCLENSGTISRTQRFAHDERGKLTWSGRGTPLTASPWARVVEKYGYDTSGNRAGVGLPYNTAPDWCREAPGGTPQVAAACSAIYSDAMNRPRIAKQNGDGFQCFDYDKQGNVSVVASCGRGFSYFPLEGIDSAIDGHPCLGANSLCGELPPTNYSFSQATYKWDDFGNLVEYKGRDRDLSMVPSEKFEYNALGLPIKHRTPEVGNTPIVLTYDQLGRPLKRNSGNTVLTEFKYDDPNSSLGQGRLFQRIDPLGTTTYTYNSDGQVVSEKRSSGQYGGCAGGTGTEWQPTEDCLETQYGYDAADGRLLTIRYPHKRLVTYSYFSGNGLRRRIQSISARVHKSTGDLDIPVATNITWHPFAGLASYVITAQNAATGAQTATVEYALGDANLLLTNSPSRCDSSRSASIRGNDATGRLRGVLVSAGDVGATGRGDIYRQTFTWKQDQILATQTCVRSSSATARTLKFQTSTGTNGYDSALRIVHSYNSNQSAAGGPYSNRDYGYDFEGNRTSQTDDGCGYSFTYPYSAQPDLLTGRASTCTGSYLSNQWEYDAGGRTTHATWHTDSTGLVAYEHDFDYGVDLTHAAYDSVFRQVTVGQPVASDTSGGLAIFDYYYDAFGRRGQKMYPSSRVDKFMYDTGHQLLEDRGVDTQVENLGAYPIDEYIWLDGRPVALLRSTFDLSWSRQYDLTGSCQRNGRASDCGVFFIVTDYIGKPVAMIDSNRLIVGAADYDPFGHVNRISYHGDSEHPYAGATTAYPANMRQPLLGTQVRVRALYHLLDTEAGMDTVQLTNNTQTAFTPQQSGHHKGNLWSYWFNLPSADPTAYVKFDYSADSWNCNPTGSDSFDCNLGTAYPYTGVTVEGFEYERYDNGVTNPTFTNLRFPGQYYDEETGLYENWHRYYDPSIGRYLQPEPMMANPNYVAAIAASGSHLNPYAYAASNPMVRADPNGLWVVLFSGELSASFFVGGGIGTGFGWGSDGGAGFDYAFGKIGPEFSLSFSFTISVFPKMPKIGNINGSGGSCGISGGPVSAGYSWSNAGTRRTVNGSETTTYGGGFLSAGVGVGAGGFYAPSQTWADPTRPWCNEKGCPLTVAPGTQQ